MAYPEGIGVVDLMIGFPIRDRKRMYDRLMKAGLKDEESREGFTFPAEYMFKDVPEKDLDTSDPVGVTLREMDLWGIERAMVGVSRNPESPGARALRDHPTRFIASAEIDPNKGMDCVRKMVELKEMYDVRAFSCFPSGLFPQVAINDKKMYPIYAKCVELGTPIFVCAGVPGPRLKMEPQRVELIDEVMYDFPDLVFVTRHGCEPWTDLAVKLMLKWPGLHYSTSGFAPRYYPRAIIDYANTRGADKVIYAGYFPFGLTLERIMIELAEVGFADQVWPKFLRTNALRVLGLDR